MKSITDHTMNTPSSIPIVAGFLALISSAYAAPGSLDPSFNVSGKVITAISNGNDKCYGMEIQNDGKIILAGYSTGLTGLDFAVARYLSDGSLDTTFNGNGKVSTPGAAYDSGYSLALQPDGKIVVGGSSASGTQGAILRYDTNGTLDSNFNGTGKVIPELGSVFLSGAVAVQSDGKILYAGSIKPTDSFYDFCLMRFESNGTLDTSFNSTGKVITSISSKHDIVRSVTIQSDNKILVAGKTFSGTTYSTADFALVRYNPDGTLDTSFNGTGTVTTAVSNSADEVFGVAMQSDGKILVTGYYTNNLNYSGTALVRYNSNGSLDTTFNGTGKATSVFGFGGSQGYSVAVQNDGKIIVSGVASATGATADFALIRYNINGSIDTTLNGTGTIFTPVGNGTAYGERVVIQSDGKVVVAGYCDNGTNYDFAMARYDVGSSSPEIFIEQPLNGGVNDGGSRTFGSVAFGANTSLTFTIKNTGNADLTGLVITKDGTDSADFTVTASPTAPVAGPSGSTTFTVRFAPTTSRAKTAAIHIANNDADENPYDITLAGTGGTAASVFNDTIAASSSLSGADALPTAIPFNDGVENLLKYAFNMNLTGPDSSSLVAGTGTAGLPAFALVGTGPATEIRMEFLRRKGSGLIYTAKHSTDLDSFAPMTGTTTVTPINDQWERVLVQEPCNPATTPKCFGIVEVSLP